MQINVSADTLVTFLSKHKLANDLLIDNQIQWFIDNTSQICIAFFVILYSSHFLKPVPKVL